MESEAEKELLEFEEKVRKTVYLDNLSPQVTSAVIKTALGQFGTVLNVQFIRNYNNKESKNKAQCALVEMETDKQAKAIISEMKNYPFMMSGMPRPVRARDACAHMFVDRPRKPRRKLQCKWVDPKDPDFEVANKIKFLVRKHTAEAAYLLKLQLEEEEKLAKQQAEALNVNYKKYEMIEKLQGDKVLGQLANRYRLRITDD
ncbi:hypothetical protein IFM89_032843 [Coptis chinensis]|uniref:RRM domain-containing protein n=1 Tax=Coptis chinensis TaxID=261450 RepID=A0A835IFT1_9MAGN|nr:hypothetical protein IFM89_032843 [Coptis chinensis]